MEDFSNLPLDEKKKQAQAGDIVVTDRGARLPFIHADKLVVTVALEGHRNYPLDIEFITDIIRPTARKVPEVVYMIDREVKSALAADTQEEAISALIRAVSAVADHFEKETP